MRFARALICRDWMLVVAAACCVVVA